MLCCNSDVIREDEVPKDMRAEAEAYRQELVERVSEVDDQLAEMFIGNTQLTYTLPSLLDITIDRLSTSLPFKVDKVLKVYFTGSYTNT